KKAKKFSGEGTNKNLEISEFVPYPSPFNPIKEPAHIRIDINRDAIGDVYILDLAANPVKTINNVNLTTGLNEIEWDGKNSSGRICNNGVYSIVIKAKSGNLSVERYTKVMLIKGEK
ncbi:MAG: hypothetical protein GWP03_06390, partial [Proteobacteria bacterium]|nr:hypothetical protein [Pseudomonadota bacterium]